MWQKIIKLLLLLKKIPVLTPNFCVTALQHLKHRELKTEPRCVWQWACVHVCECNRQSERAGGEAKSPFRHEWPDGTPQHEVLAKENTKPASEWTHVLFFPMQWQVYSITTLPTSLLQLSERINWTFGAHACRATAWHTIQHMETESAMTVGLLSTKKGFVIRSRKLRS